MHLCTFFPYAFPHNTELRIYGKNKPFFCPQKLLQYVGVSEVLGLTWHSLLKCNLRVVVMTCFMLLYISNVLFFFVVVFFHFKSFPVFYQPSVIFCRIVKIDKPWVRWIAGLVMTPVLPLTGVCREMFYCLFKELWKQNIFFTNVFEY